MIGKYLCLNFYSNNILFCDKIYSNDKTAIKKNIFSKDIECYNPLFFKDVVREIENNNPELIIVNTHNDNKNSYLHTDFLKSFLKGFILLKHAEYKELNMSIYVKEEYEYNYEYIQTDQHLIFNNIQTLCVYIKSDIGNLSFISVNKPENDIMFKQEWLHVLLQELLSLYIDNTNVNFYFLLMHLSGLTNNHYYVVNDVYQQNTQYNIIKSETIMIDNIDNHDIQATIFDITKQSKKILCFTWNTDKIPLCDNLYKDMNEHERNRFFSSDKCYSPLFFESIKDEIIKNNPFIIAITNEGDLEKGTFFHYEFLPKEMNKLNYVLLENDKVNNIDKNDSMRLSIYLRNDIDNVDLTHINKSLFGYNETTKCSKTKAIAKYVQTPSGIIAFTSIQIPHDMLPNNVNSCLAKIKKDLLKSGKISYVFLMGDFAYNAKIDKNQYINEKNQTIDYRNYNEYIQIPNKYYKEYIYDVLDYNIKYKNLEEYNEGVLNKTLLPNYKFESIQNNENYKNYNVIDNIRNNDENMTWHNRIYFKTNHLTTYDINCLTYKIIMGFPMLYKKGHHLGTLGVYELEKIDINKII